MARVMPWYFNYKVRWKKLPFLAGNDSTPAGSYQALVELGNKAKI